MVSHHLVKLLTNRDSNPNTDSKRIFKGEKGNLKKLLAKLVVVAGQKLKKLEGDK
jgi:hypothetical protein